MNDKLKPCKLTNIDLIEGILNDFGTGISDKEETLQTLVDVVIKSVESRLEVNVPEIEWVDTFIIKNEYRNKNHREIVVFELSKGKEGLYQIFYYFFGHSYRHKKELPLKEAKAKAYDILVKRVTEIVNNYTKV